MADLAWVSAVTLDLSLSGCHRASFYDGPWVDRDQFDTGYQLGAIGAGHLSRDLVAVLLG